MSPRRNEGNYLENIRKANVSMDEKIIQASMSIILHAGDARVSCKKALEAIAVFDFEKAHQEMQIAKQKIVTAHKLQTDVIVAETGGEKCDYSVLFAHAQDTLMTIYSELTIAKQLLSISESFSHRISRLEDQVKG